MLIPCRRPATHAFSRLLPPASEAAQAVMTSKRLRDLADSMNVGGTRIPFCLKGEPPRAHYTYLGQFVAHDLTRDDTPLKEAASNDWTELSNKRTPWLDLDALYGDGPGSTRHGHLYESDGTTFRVGARRSDGRPFDVPVGSTAPNGHDEEGVRQKPLLADDRNNENVVIRQIHAIFLLLHNRAVAELRQKGESCDVFERARQRVQWQYQWIVRHDLLPAICSRQAYTAVVEEGWTQISWSPEGFLIPVEFAHAVARFGHSMVRERYPIKAGADQTPLTDLLAEARTGDSIRPEFQIDWKVFCKAISHSIDTTVAPPLFDLDPRSVALFVTSGAPARTDGDSLPARTLRRGACLRLATGQQAAAALGLEPSLDDGREPPDGYTPFNDSDSLGFTGNLPLWYYILLEAELKSRGRSLGPLGSRLMCEVIEGSLAHDRGSIVHQLRADPDWVPPPWRADDGKLISATTFVALTHVVGLATKPAS